MHATCYLGLAAAVGWVLAAFLFLSAWGAAKELAELQKQNARELESLRDLKAKTFDQAVARGWRQN